MKNVAFPLGTPITSIAVQQGFRFTDRVIRDKSIVFGSAGGTHLLAVQR